MADARLLAKLGSNPDCGIAAAMVDVDAIVKGTAYDPGFGQSQAAFARGARFETACEGPTGGFGPLLTALADVGLAVPATGVLRIQGGSDAAKALQTRRELIAMAQGRSAYALLREPVLELQAFGMISYIRPDALVVTFHNGELVTVELKGFSTRDGVVPDEKIARAADQVSAYQLVLRRLDPAIAAALSDTAVVVCASGLGLTPKAFPIRNGDRITTLEIRLAAAERRRTSLGVVPHVDPLLDAQGRLDLFEALELQLGTAYRPGSCISNCAGFQLCRSRSDERTRLGVRSGALAAVPDVATAIALAGGATPAAGQHDVAAHLRVIERLANAAGL